MKVQNEARIHCFTGTKPVWTHNGIILETYRVQNSLLLTRVKSTDAGVYRCHGKKKNGKVFTAASLLLVVCELSSIFT